MQQPAPIRKAVLISCPGGGRNTFLRGAVRDPVNVASFLMSPTGGSWCQNEIIPLSNPSYPELQALFGTIHADYLMVYFSGHGYTNRDGLRMLCFGNYDIPDTAFSKCCHKLLIIVDACRTIPGASISGIPELLSQYSFAPAVAQWARQLFNSHIICSPQGHKIIHATQTGLPAYDEFTGGVFTSSLLMSAMEAEGIQNFEPISIENLIEPVTNRIFSKGFKQYPGIAYTDGNLCVPFALNTPKIKVQRSSRQDQYQNPENDLIKTAGLLLCAYALGNIFNGLGNR